MIKEHCLGVLGIISGPSTAGVSIYSLVDHTTPVISWVGMVLGIIVTLLAGIYYSQKIFKKKN